MNGLLLASESQSKDIKFDPKKVLNIQDNIAEENSDFFQELFAEILEESPDEDAKTFLLAKLLNLPSDIEKKEHIRASFSGEKLFTDHQIDKVSVETLIEIASLLKTQPDQTLDFPTDSQKLKTALLDLQVQKSFKEATTIKELLKIAKDNGIEVKNFEFFKEEAALDNHAKEMVKKINSEEIFKLIEKNTRISGDHTQTMAKHIEYAPQNKSEKPALLKELLHRTEQHKEISPTDKISTQDQKRVTDDHKHIKVESSVQSETKHTHKSNTKTMAKDDTATLQISSSKPDNKHTQSMAAPETDTPIMNKIIKEKPHSNTTHHITHTLPKNNQKATPKPSENLKNIVRNQDVKEQVLSTKSTDKISIQEKPSPISNKSTINSNTVANHITQNNTIEKTEKTDAAFHKTVLKTTTMNDLPAEQSSEENNLSTERHTVSYETKSTSLHTHKTEQPELKKTFHTFAQDFKEKVENYKPPLMKIKMQLNPVNLGEVDVTLINRGNNLHVNINSNPNTIALFVQNQAEFKNALVNMGFSGLQMQFGENKEGNRGQQHKHNEKNTPLFEENQSETDGFEMIVPRYI